VRAVNREKTRTTALTPRRENRREALIMSYTKPLTERERALENAFFQKENQRLLVALRSRESQDRSRDALASALGITHPDILEPLIKLGLRNENVAALMMAPLVTLAWADQTLDNEERRALLEAESVLGIEPESGAERLIDAWLDEPPSSELLDAWCAYVAELRQLMPSADYERLRNQIRTLASAIARAIEKSFLRSGGPTRRERAVLARIEEAFATDGDKVPKSPSEQSLASGRSTLDDALRAMS